VVTALGLIAGLNALYFVLMVLAYIPPNSAVQKYAGRSIEVLENEKEQEGQDYHSFPRVEIEPGFVVTTDSFAERWMFERAIKNTGNPVLAAVDANGYGRYWHGYITVLRPLLLVMGIKHIRYGYIFVILLLLFTSAHLIAKKINYAASLAYLTSLGMCHVYLLPLSIDYASVFIIMMTSVIMVCRLYTKWDECRLFYFFAAAGSLTNFVDFLTAPLVTLMYPLVVCFYFRQMDCRLSCAKKIFFIIKNSFGWFLGYGVTWMIKWLLLLVFQGPSALKTVVSSISYRTLNITGGVYQGINAVQTLKLNISRMFPPAAALAALVLFAIWFCLFVVLRKRNRRAVHIAPVLLVCLYPYIWYMVLKQHSHQHDWFTFRIQGGAVFAALLFLVDSVDWDALSPPQFSLKKNVQAVLRRFNTPKPPVR
jgi:hypothetical protein